MPVSDLDDHLPERSGSPAWVAPESDAVTDSSEPSHVLGIDPDIDGDLAPTRESDWRDPSPPPVPLRPLTYMEVLDLGFEVIRSRPAHALVASAVLSIPIQVIIAISTRRTFGGASFSEMVDNTTTVQLAGNLDGSAGVGTTLLAIFGPLFATAFVSVALGGVVSAGLRNEYVTPTQMLRTAVRRLPALAVSWTIAHLAIVVGLFLFVLPGIVLAVGWYLLAPVVGIELASISSALTRPWVLARRKFLRVVTIWALSGLVLFMLSVIGTIFPAVFEAVLDVEWVWIVRAFVSSAVSLLSVALGGSIGVIAYLDLRARVEGLDLEMTLRNIHAR